MGTQKVYKIGARNIPFPVPEGTLCAYCVVGLNGRTEKSVATYLLDRKVPTYGIESYRPLCDEHAARFLPDYRPQWFADLRERNFDNKGGAK